MRLRNVPGAREVMVENEYVFTEPEECAEPGKRYLEMITLYI